MRPICQCGTILGHQGSDNCEQPSTASPDAYEAIKDVNGPQ